MTRTVSQEYIRLVQETSLYRENNDCAVKAVALVAKISYAESHALFKKLGRQNGQGVKHAMIHLAMFELNRKIRTVKIVEEFCHQYPGVHANKLHATTHQPARFNKVWKNGKTYLAFTKGHVLAVINGEVHDWTSTKSNKIISMLEIS